MGDGHVGPLEQLSPLFCRPLSRSISCFRHMPTWLIPAPICRVPEGSGSVLFFFSHFSHGAFTPGVSRWIEKNQILSILISLLNKPIKPNNNLFPLSLSLPFSIQCPKEPPVPSICTKKFWEIRVSGEHRTRAEHSLRKNSFLSGIITSSDYFSGSRF